MSIYTKKGDAGETGTADNKRRPKTDQLFELLGQLDTLNAALGLAVNQLGKPKQPLDKLVSELVIIQSDIFSLGAVLAGSPPPSDYKRLLTERTGILEERIDGWEGELPPLRNFILPGGDATAAILHLARSYARGVEREFLRQQSTGGQDKANAQIGAYLNRLSDFLFQAARYCNHQLGQSETTWKGR